MFIQAFQVVLAPIPGEFTGAVGGFFFDALPTVVYSSVGLTVGSIIAFLAARIIGLPLVKLVVSSSTLDKFRFVTESRGTLAVLLLFIIPGFPKDILSYLLGLSPMGFARFVAVCAIGRIPGTVMLSFSGAALFDENWTLFAALAALCAVLLVILFLFRDRIELRIKNEEGEAP